jgi:hypothetical protein
MVNMSKDLIEILPVLGIINGLKTVQMAINPPLLGLLSRKHAILGQILIHSG